MRLWLLAHAATAGSRRGDFPCGESLDDGGRRSAAGVVVPTAVETVRCGPSPACRETAALLGRPVDGDAPAGPDPGQWAGRGLTDVDPAALGAWLAGGAPPDGEAVSTCVDRVAAWMDGLGPDDAYAVVDPPVVRAAVAHALGAGTDGTWRVDVAPLTLALLTGRSGRWNLRALTPAGPGTCP